MAPNSTAIEDTVDVISDDLNKTSISSPSSCTTTGENLKPIIYTEEELAAIRETHKLLVEEHNVDPSRIGLKFLALVTIVSKLRSKRAADKYKQFLDNAESCGLAGLTEDYYKKEALRDLKDYQVAGKTLEGRCVNWVKGKGYVPIEDEKMHAEAGLMYFMAVHADPVSLREGIVFVTIPPKSKPAKIGNEKKIKSLYMSYPMRPQKIMVGSESVTTKILVKGMITVGSLFSSNKMLKRLSFMSEDEIVASFPKETLPKIYGGDAGGWDSSIEEWVKVRLENIPVPEL
eukprot:CAMPEP_0185731396 /NCGR_PEP_ID=MMETSP1171-20130828/12794_1 /TAXON_ID=374046 /ORGANISM="Helicotheca tamensis, Strain CCMP826" /LENGTH=287 /DNA_ID=CAMNT_0028400655 /DNA_START=7 /DNA_END=870 /DNA_ORIENTATION=-